MTRDERQDLCVENWIKEGKCRATLICATGFGKTNVAIKASKRFLNKNQNGRITVVVPSEPLQIQWISILKASNIKANVLIINSAIKEIRKTDFLIIDELHTALSEEFIKVFSMIKHTLFLGLTATIERLDNRNELIKRQKFKGLPSEVAKRMTFEEQLP